MKHIVSSILLALLLNLCAAQDTIQKNMKITITTPTNNLEESLNFYKKLNYSVLSKESPTLVTDGAVIIEIDPDRYARAGVKMYKSSWAEEVAQLKELTTLHKTDNGHLLNDFNGCWIYLIEGDLEVEEGPSGAATGMAGNFQGLSLESADMKRSFAVWEVLGFKTQMGDAEKGFVVLSEPGGFGVSLMKPMSCPHLFFNPSMTFFNGKENMKIIENIRAAGIPMTEEITIFNDDNIVDNIIIRDPGGLGFFIFSD